MPVRFSIPAAAALLQLLATSRVSAFSLSPSSPSSSSTASSAAKMDNFVLGTLNLATLEEPEKLLDQSWERGFYRFDLARTYGMGKSETVFGRWMRANGNRDQVELVTKGGMGEDKYGHPDRTPCSLAMLQGEIHASLEALQTDSVDLYMYHRDDPRIPVEDFVDWMNELKRANLIQRWGVSNWNWERVQKACKYAAANGLEPPTATSPQMSLAVPDGEVWPSTHSLSCPTQQDELDWYQQNNIQVMGWESLAKGFMAKPDQWKDVKQQPSKSFEVGSDAWRLHRLQSAYCTPANFARREEAVAIAQAHDLTLAQVALLYALHKGPHVSVLVGAGSPEHLDEMCQIREHAVGHTLVQPLAALDSYSRDLARVPVQAAPASRPVLSIPRFSVPMAPSNTTDYGSPIFASLS